MITRTTHQNRRGLVAVATAGLLTAAAVAQPVLSARIDGVAVNSFDTVQFPAAVAVGDTLRIVVVLRNDGDQTLTFTSDPAVSLAGGFPEQFALLQPALGIGNTIPVNGSTAFAIDLAPDAPIESVFTNVFLFTNASAAPFRLRFEGNVAVPRMRVEADGAAVTENGTVDFGDVRLGEAAEVSFEIFNDGSGTLELTNAAGPVALSSSADGFALLEQPAASLAPGESSTFRVRFTPAAVADATVTMEIETNTLSNPQFGFFAATLTAAGRPLDCNGNGVDDPEDIAGGTSTDCDGNGIPDDCELDSDGDGVIDACETADPNTPVVDEDEPVDPNTPVQDTEERVDPNTPVQNGDVADPNAPLPNGADPNDAFNGEIDEDVFVPTSFCGFGVGFASLMSLASLGGYRRGRRPAR